MAAVTPEMVRESLRKCMDPEVPVNIVDMGLIYGIDVAGSGDVGIRMTMTTRGCPLHDTIVSDVTRHAKAVPGVGDVKVDIVWDPPWSMDRMSDEGRAALRAAAPGIGAGSPAPVDYETAMPQGVGKLVKQEDGSMVLANEHDQGFMVNQAIVDFWRSCNGRRRITELVDVFAAQTGMQRGQVEREVLQLVEQLREGGLVAMAAGPEAPNVEFRKGGAQGA